MADRSTPSGTIYHLRYLDADNNVLQKSVYIADSRGAPRPGADRRGQAHYRTRPERVAGQGGGMIRWLRRLFRRRRPVVVIANARWLSL
jgi:hypothetical protein